MVEARAELLVDRLIDRGVGVVFGLPASASGRRPPSSTSHVENDTLGQIEWEQMVFLGDPEYGVDLQPIDFATYAEACGAAAFHGETPAEVEGALASALRAPGPAVVEAVEPPMPTQVTPDQAVKLAESLARGQPNAGRIALTIFRDKVRDLTGT